MRDKFDKFDEPARHVLSLAQEEAQRFNHNYIGTEHLLLGLIREIDGVAANVLGRLGVEQGKVRQAIEVILGRGDHVAQGEIGLTPRAKKVIELAVDEARRLNHHYIGTEHLLLGLIREGEGIAAGVLQSLGVSLEAARAETLRVLSQQAPEPGAAPEASAPAPAEGAFTSLRADTAAGEQFARFTERARKVLSLAQEEAQRLNHDYIGTEHVLLALVREGDGVAAKMLATSGVTLEPARQQVALIVGIPERAPAGHSGLTSRARQALGQAVEEARALNQHYVGTEHLLLGLVRVGESTASAVLTSMRVDLERLRALTTQTISAASSAHTAAAIPAAGPDTTPAPMLEVIADGPANLTERARKVLTLAKEEAQFLNHSYIGTEHLLLGLVREGDGVAARALQNLGIELRRVRSAVEFIIGRGDRIVLGEIGLTPRAKTVIELAADEARQLNQRNIGTEHLLLGLIREGQGIAAGVLRSLGGSVETVRAETLRVLRLPATQEAAAQPAGPDALAPASSTSAAAQEAEAPEWIPEVLRAGGQFPTLVRALSFAQEEARSSNHAALGTEHLLLGLLRAGDGIVAALLAPHGITVEAVRERVEALEGHVEQPLHGPLPLTRGAQQTLTLTQEEARALGHPALGPEHLLLALVSQRQTDATYILQRLGADPEHLRAMLLQALGPEPTTDPSDVPQP